MKNLICSKTTSLGGGCPSYKPYVPGLHEEKRPILDVLSKSNVAIAIDQQGKISYLKNRWGETKNDIHPNEVVVLLSDMLSRNLFNDRMSMFQEHFKEKVVEAIQEVIKREGSR